MVQASNGSVVARDNGTVSGSADPAYSFTTDAVLDDNTAYEVHYWIDSNFGDGTVGVCEDIDTDHQWSVAVPAPSDDVTITESHDPGTREDVCATFEFDLTFSGDDSFQGPHGDQAIYAAVVTLDGTVIGRASSTVSSTADPAFSFSFPGALAVGIDREVHYWIDSNFGGGTEGECDVSEIDHQWIIDVPTVEGDVDITDTHRPGEVEDVCGATAPVSFANDIQPIFTNNCAFSGCHGAQNTQPPGGPMELSAGQAYNNIVNVASTELPSMDRIEPGQPDDSYLIHKLQGTQLDVGGSGDQMPQGRAPLSEETINLIRRWVSEGAIEN